MGFCSMVLKAFIIDTNKSEQSIKVWKHVQMQQLSIFQKRHPSRGEFTPCWETLPYELQSKNHCHKEKKSNRNSLQMKLSLLGIYLQDA